MEKIEIAKILVTFGRSQITIYATCLAPDYS